MISLDKIQRFFSSKLMTVVLMILAGLIMAYITVCEAVESTDKTPYRLYLSWWFILLLAFVWLNLGMNLLRRGWWNRKRLPLTMSHLGFLLILTGGFATYALGVRGNLVISEGNTRNAFEVDGQVLNVADSGSGIVSPFLIEEDLRLRNSSLWRYLNITLNPFADRNRAKLENGLEVSVLERMPSSRSDHVVVSVTDGEGPPALVLSAQGGPPRRIVIQEGAATQIVVGEEACTLAFMPRPQGQGPLAQLLQAEATGFFRETLALSTPGTPPVQTALDLPGDIGKELILGDYSVRILEYHPAFTVGGEPDLEAPPTNPTLKVQAVGPGGDVEMHLFALHDFHGRNNLSDGTVLSFRRPTTPRAVLFLLQENGAVETLISLDEAAQPFDGESPLQLDPATSGPVLNLVEVWPASGSEVRLRTDHTGQGPPAFHVQVGAEGEPAWISEQHGTARSRDGSTSAKVSRNHVLGFSLTLDDAVAEYWPASRIPRAYYSNVRVKVGAANEPRPERIETNAPLLMNRFRLYQSGMDQEFPYRYSVFSVSRDPGVFLVTAGFLMMSAGLLWLYLMRFILKPVRKRRAALILVLMLASTAFIPAAHASPAAAPVDPDQEIGARPDPDRIAELIVLADGRQKPMASQARETVRDLFAGGFHDQALATYLALICDPLPWMERACLPVDPELARAVFDGQRKVTPRAAFEAYESLNSIITEARRKEMMISAGRSEKPAGAELELRSRQAMELVERFMRLHELSSSFRIFPRAAEEGDWLTPEEAQKALEQGDERFKPGLAAWDRLRTAFLDEDGVIFAAAAADLISHQRSWVDAAVLPERMVTLENLYYAVDVLVVGLALFALTTLFYMLRAFGARPALASLLGWTRPLSVVALTAAILWNLWIVGGFTAMAGRLPLRNLNEVYLVVLFLVPLIGTFLQMLLRAPLYGGVAAGLTLAGFVGALNLDPSGYDVAPLVAILISPWRQVHVLTIMFSYALLLVAMGLHLAFLMVRLKEIRSGSDSSPGTMALELDRRGRTDSG